MSDRYQTSPTLLKRLADLSDHEAWARFIDLYCPLITRFVSRYEDDATELEEIVHRVCVRVLAAIPSFHYDPQKGRFRNWLCVVSVREVRLIREQAARNDVQILKDQHHTKDIESVWDDEFKAYVLERALQNIRDRFTDETWSAFEQQWVHRCDVEEVAKKMGKTPSWMYQQKSTVMKALRDEVERLSDDSSLFIRPN